MRGKRTRQVPRLGAIETEQVSADSLRFSREAAAWGFYVSKAESSDGFSEAREVGDCEPRVAVGRQAGTGGPGAE